MIRLSVPFITAMQYMRLCTHAARFWGRRKPLRAASIRNE